MGAVAMAGGAFGGASAPAVGGKMATFAAPALRKVRVGCVGLGSRGSGAVHRLAMIPGVEVAALCDIRGDVVAQQTKWLKARRKPAPRTFVGEHAWKDLCHRGILGEIKHGEGAYIHDLRVANLNGYWDRWRFKWNAAHKGDLYPTHGLGPICFDMDINRGDRLDYLVSLESQQAGLSTVARMTLPEDAWQRKAQVQAGDMNTTLIKTAKGRSIMIQHDVSSPRPYSRINLISGTRGMLCDYPYRLALESRPGGGAHGFDDRLAAEYRKTYMHPLWKRAGEIAKKVGGHGGMDFLMDLRWAYCLQNGLPLDMNVYDLASWCAPNSRRSMAAT